MSFWHFSKLPTGLIPHPLYGTINSSEEQERQGEMDSLTVRDNNEFPTVCTEMYTPTASLSHPVVIVYHITTPKTTSQYPGSAVESPTCIAARKKKRKGYEEASKAEETWVRPWTISGGLWFEGETVSGARWALGRVILTRQGVISY